MNELQQKIDELLRVVKEQEKTINDMKDVIRFCARTDVGTHYQQQVAYEMIVNNNKIYYDRWNPDGTYTARHKEWIRTHAGEKALMAIEKEEKELLGI